MGVLRISALLAVGVLLCFGVPSSAEDNALATGPHAFDDGIETARKALDEGKCEEAVKALMALLEAHKEKNYAKGRRIEIEELMRHLVCGSKYKLPRAKDVVSGKLHSWSRKTGKIRITYTPKTAQDWEKRDGLLYLPARITGPFTLEIKGKSYPAGQKNPPRAVLGGDQHPETSKVQHWRADFGVPARSPKSPSPIPPSFIFDDGGEEKELSKKKKAPGKIGKKYKLVLKATKTSVQAKVGSTTIGTSKKAKGVYGYLGFHASGWEEVKLTAVIDPSWIEGQVDEILLTRLEEFDSEYDPTQYLPDWLSDPITKEAFQRRAKGVNPVDKIDEKHTDLLNDIWNGVRLEEYDEALAAIDKLQAAGVSEAACEFLRADARLKMIEPEKALEHIKRAIELEPKYMEAVVLQSELLRQLGRFDEALDNFIKLADVYAGSPRAYREAATALMTAGRPEDARRITKLAARNGITSSDLVELNAALAKVERGPRWKKRFQHRSQNYHVMSDIDQTTCVEASNLLEESFQAYRKRFAWVERDTTRLFRVFIFSGRAGFKSYMMDIPEFFSEPPDMAAGLYTPLLKQLLIWTHANKKQVLHTVRHEGWHQYLDRVMPDPPTWYNEGLAEYHENAIRVEGKLEFGQMHRNHIRLLKGRGLIKLEKLFYMPPRKFYRENTFRNYGQSWLTVHMLQHSKKEYLDIFKAYTEDLKNGGSITVTRRHFPPELLTKLDKALKKYLDSL